MDKKTYLVVGASGATGKLLTYQLLKNGHRVKAIVRSKDSLPKDLQMREGLSLIEASILELPIEQLMGYVKDCDGVASTLGHNLTFKGVFMPPRNLVADAVSLLIEAIKMAAPGKKVRFVLMNTSGNKNKDLGEKVSIWQDLVLMALRALVPPHLDNEKASERLRSGIGQNHELIEWVAVRPDGLINEEGVTLYDIYPSPIRSAIFNAGKTSRINVAHFMGRLLYEDALWQKWKGKMPVIYNKE